MIASRSLRPTYQMTSTLLGPAYLIFMLLWNSSCDVFSITHFTRNYF